MPGAWAISISATWRSCLRFLAATPSPPTRFCTISRGEASRPIFCRGAGRGQGRILRDHTLGNVASRHGTTPAQVVLAWLLRQEDLMVIPKATSLAHVRENRAAPDLTLTQADLTELARTFPLPRGTRALEML